MNVRYVGASTVLIGLVGILAFLSWWQLDEENNYYHGRWMGIWNNPNIYGILMGVGMMLTIGLLAQRKKEGGVEALNGKYGAGQLVRASSRRLRQIFLLIAVFMMGLGLVFSYSRGAWLGTAVGLAYLAWSYEKLKWRYVLTGFVGLAAAAAAIWGRTPDSVPWYVKRMDFARPSAQHRVVAWRGALHMMWDHPFGVGWNNAVTVYEKNYSPPENGAAAITTNDYLMIGTQLGWPGLICFVSYVGLCLRTKKAEARMQNEEKEKAESGNGADMACFPPSPVSAPLGRGFSRSQRLWNLLRCRLKKGSQVAEGRFEISEEERLRITCRAGAVMMLVAFWFDGGLFTLATGAVFWVLLELGREG